MSRYDASKLKTLKYLDLSKSKWRSVEVMNTDKILHDGIFGGARVALDCVNSRDSDK